MRIYGSIEVLWDEDDMICYIFNRDEKDVLVLPVSDGSRVFVDFSSLLMKFSIKDTKDRLAILGLVDWAASVLGTSLGMKSNYILLFRINMEDLQQYTI